ncbi:type IV pilus assembly protein PilW [Rheinheimera pacifica]|uniref:Type IV pilus assembly protein PilW n=1 Tax=Rheinheimera pacifica TaxID=173990 RepID=A0A1H6JLN6_9GAMM|nr:prepilin-type N-terminal cleavage/methylation domain-containing protein [Rheinheimera pacifica]SEH60677.1 type IV pilus assembly protein PilW [Rheinheimera pacifica]
MNIRVRGFSLVELMIAMVLGLLVLGGAIGVFIANQTTSRANAALSDMQSIARLSFQLMSHDIRNAGFSGCNNSMRISNVIAIAGVRPAWADWTTGSGIQGFAAPVGVINGLQAANGTQALRLMFGSGANNSISNYNGSVISLNTNPVLAAGEVAIACDESLASIFQINEAGAMSVTHGAAGLNCDANLGFMAEDDWACGLSPARGFSNNAMLMRFESIAWFVAPSRDDAGVMSLYRASLVGDSQVNEEVLYGVADLQFAYLNGDTGLFQQAAAVTAAGQWGRITAVNVSVTLDDAILQGQNVPDNVRTITFLVSLRNRLG